MTRLLRPALLMFGVLIPAAPLPGQAKEPSPQELEAIWVSWIGADEDGAAKARAGMKTMIASPQAAVAFLKTKLKPAPGADPKRIQRGIADLDSGEFAVREKAMKDLEALGVLATAALERKLLEKDSLSLEARRRIETLLQRIDDLPPTAEDLRSLRAIAVLSDLKTAEAKALLETLAKEGEGALLTELARMALAKLK